MSTIKINFDKKSIQNAIKQVNAVKKKLSGEVVETFLTKCLEWVKTRANEYLEQVDIGGNIIADIETKWDIDIKGNIGTLTNTSNKAVFVEFGVGMVGQFDPHPNANESNYQYNVASSYKSSKGSWQFKVDDENSIDLVADYYDIDNNQWVTTQGSPANLYLYNSLMDLISEMAYKTLWQESLKQTI